MTLRTFALIGSLALVASPGCWRTIVNSGPPPKVIVSSGCPFEGCQYGKWTATRATALWAEPDGLQLDVALAPGDEVDAATGEIHSTPRRARVVTAGSDDRADGIVSGDVIYALYPVGEGALAIWQNGLMKVGSLDLVVDYDPPVPVNQAPLKWTWWVKCKLADGTIAWLKDPKKFRGMDKLARPPLS